MQDQLSHQHQTCRMTKHDNVGNNFLSHVNSAGRPDLLVVHCCAKNDKQYSYILHVVPHALTRHETAQDNKRACNSTDAVRGRQSCIRLAIQTRRERRHGDHTRPFFCSNQKCLHIKNFNPVCVSTIAEHSNWSCNKKHPIHRLWRD